MKNESKNKVVVVTGGAAGIGYEIAHQFLKDGAKTVILLDLNEKQGNDAANVFNSEFGQGKAVFYVCDVTKDIEKVTKTILENHKYVDVLVNNAGILDESKPRKTIEVNVTSLIEWSLKYWELMRKDKDGKGGTIINLSSICGFRNYPSFPVYSASKHAVMGFTKSLGDLSHFNRSGVRVVAINPGFTYTNLGKGVTFKDETVQNKFEENTKHFPWQDANAVGRAALEVFISAESGTAWLIEGDRDIVSV